MERAREDCVDEAGEGTEIASWWDAVRLVCEGLREGMGRCVAVVRELLGPGISPVARACFLQSAT